MIRLLTLYLLAFLASVALRVSAQPDLPPAGEVFVDTIVPRVDIFIDPDTLIWLYENVESDQEFHATFKFDNGNISETIENAGFRLRGNTSRYSAKKSFKVSFNTFEPGRQWYGLEKLNLNGEHNDPSVIRSKLCWDLLTELGVPGSRSNHVELYINDNYHGLYINVEHIDEEFVLSRFGNNDGNLYKCLWPADLAYLGSDPDNYKVMVNDRRMYDLKTNTGEDDYSDLANFIDVLNNTPDEDFKCALEAVFNVYDYLKIIAFDVITADWDGYIFNKNNFYLYFNTETGKFEYINYDLDNTFGIDWFNIDWTSRDPYAWHDGFRPLYTRIMANQEFRDQYTYYLKKISDDLLENDSYTAYVNEIKTRNAPYVQSDPFYPLDYGFTYNDYLASYIQALGMHVKAGLFPFIDDRKSSLAGQLEENSPLPAVKYIANNHPQAGEVFKIRACIDILADGGQVKAIYAIGDNPAAEAEMFDDGEHWDKGPGDGIFGCLLEEMQVNSVISYQVSAVNPDGQPSIMPCEPKLYELVASENAALFINEFMASNSTTIADEFGEFDDWIEIYNGGEEPVWLGDKYLTDNLGNENKWPMPDITLGAGEFALFWADDDPEQGAMHTNFKLDAGGEEIGIFDAENTGFYLLDSISFGPQDTDVSMGRKPDGDDNWIFFTVTTPGYSNALGGLDEQGPAVSPFGFFPNPVLGDRIYFNRRTSFTVFSGQGQPVLKGEQALSASIGDLAPGMYLIMTSEGACAKLVIHR